MGLLTPILRRQAADHTPGPLDNFWYQPIAGQTSITGVRVDPDTALKTSALYASVRVLAETIAQLPFGVFERLDPRGNRRAIDHPLDPVLHSTPNLWQTSFEWREMMMGHAILRGNGYSQIIPDGRGAVILLPLNPTRVTPTRLLTGEIVYKFLQMNGVTITLLEDEVFHLRGMAPDGLVGKGVVELARDSIGIAVATEQHAGRVFSQSGVPDGVLQMDGTLSKEAGTRVAESWQRKYSGLENAHKVAILEAGLKWQSIGMSAEDTQLIESRKFSVNDIARWNRVPPHMIGELERATFSNVEEQSRNFVIYSLTPWVVRFEQALIRDLFPDPTFFPKINVNGLMRGDTKVRSNYYRTLLAMGVFTRNEVRELEDMNPLEGLDEPLVQLNTGTGNPAPADQSGVSSSVMMMANYAAKGVVLKEITAIKRIASKTSSDATAFAAAVNDFYESHAEHLHDVLGIGADDAVSYVVGQKTSVLFDGPDVVEGWMESVPDDLVDLVIGVQD